MACAAYIFCSFSLFLCPKCSSHLFLSVVFTEHPRWDIFRGHSPSAQSRSCSQKQLMSRWLSFAPLRENTFLSLLFLFCFCFFVLIYLSGIICFYSCYYKDKLSSKFLMMRLQLHLNWKGSLEETVDVNTPQPPLCLVGRTLVELVLHMCKKQYQYLQNWTEHNIWLSALQAVACNLQKVWVK